MGIFEATLDPVRVVLHGGLGNQLFQYFIGLAEASRLGAPEVRLLPDLLSRYAMARNLEIRNLVNSVTPGIRVVECRADLLARIRLPKLVKKLAGYETRLCVPGYGTLLDGYFQELHYYADYDRAQLAKIISGWRTILAKQGLLGAHDFPNVIHIRLGDFFKEPSAARQFARQQLLGLSEGTDVVTDDEDIVAEALTALDCSFRIKLRSTRGLSPWDVFSVFGQYKQIRTNGSTLAFWAAVLSCADFESSNSEHVAIWRFLTVNGIRNVANDGK